jgi:hypothetical protein
MGTRSNTLIIETGSTKEYIVANMYRQFDGYPSGHGLTLAKFLATIDMVNGMSLDEKFKVANGVGCLAAQIVAHFKTGAGNIYLDAPTKKAGMCVNDYTYVIRANTYEPAGIDIQVFSYGNQVFRGNARAFLTFCEADQS